MRTRIRPKMNSMFAAARKESQMTRYLSVEEDVELMRLVSMLAMSGGVRRMLGRGGERSEQSEHV